MKRMAKYAALAGLTVSMAVPMTAQAAVRVYVIGGNCGGNLWSGGGDWSVPDEPEWFPGQGGSAQPDTQGRPEVPDEPEWFPGQGGGAQPDTQGRPEVPDEPEWFPGQGEGMMPDQQNKPDIQWPDIQWPDIQWPDIQWPDIQQPDVQKPDVQRPDTQKPDTQLPGQDTGTNQARAYIEGVIELVNRERTAAGLSSVREDSRLTAAAAIRAQEIARSFSHTRPNGSHFSTVLSQNGISYINAGENIAYGFSTPAAVMNSWMNSASHRANILDSRYVNIGIGYYQSGGTIYCTQLFTY